MFSEGKQQRSERGERLLLSLMIFCGASLPQEAKGAVPSSRSAELVQPLSLEDEKVIENIAEHSLLARAIDVVQDQEIQAAGYKGNISVLRKRAKSQIPLLYNVGWKRYGGREHVALRHPVVNTEIFTEGASIYFDIPDEARLQEIGIANSDIESITPEIIKATSILTTLPARRVSRREDSNLVVFFDDHPKPIFIIDADTGNLSNEIAGHPIYLAPPSSTASFFPIGTIHPIKFIEPGHKGGVNIPLTSLKDNTREVLSKVPLDEKTRSRVIELGKAYYVQSNLYITIHEICHFLGYGHSNESGHILYPGTSHVTDVVYPEEITGRKAVIPDYASVYTDKDGLRYGIMPGFGDIRKSPIVDMNFFLRIFAKQNKEHLLKQQKDKQE